jgi:hypothetical protein
MYTDPFGLDTLKPTERQALGNTCQTVDCNKVQVHRGEDGGIRNAWRKVVLTVSGGRAVTLGNHVYLPNNQAHDTPTLAHEVTHSGQYQQWGAGSYYAKGAGARISEALGGNPYSLPSPLPADKPFGSYGMEQQGQIVENCFSGNAGGACGVSPYHPNP